jgi:hypothetical protein
MTALEMAGPCAGCARDAAAVRGADSFPLLAAYAGAAATPPDGRDYASWLCNDCGAGGHDVAWLRAMAARPEPLTVVSLPGQPNEVALAADDVAAAEAAADDDR